MSSPLTYSPITFTARALYSIESAPLHARIDRVSVVFPDRFEILSEAGVVKVKDDNGRELSYNIDVETESSYHCTLIRDYRPELDEADFIDDTAEDCCGAYNECCETVPSTDEGEDIQELYDFETPGTVTVLLFNGMPFTASDVVSLLEAGERLYLEHADGRMSVVTAPFVSYTIDEPFLDETELTEQACSAPEEPQLDREAYDGLKAKIHAENEQRAATQAFLDQAGKAVEEFFSELLAAAVVSAAVNR